MPVVFLDRDGVINENRDDYVKSWNEFRFLPRALDALRMLTAAGCRIFVVTNQAGVHRGLLSRGTLDGIHRRLRAVAGAAGAQIEGVRYCPHRPDENCSCRKPNPGMLLDLARVHGVSLSQSFMVGDAASDVVAGQRAGCRTILVRTGRGVEQLAAMSRHSTGPDLVAHDIFDAARAICTGAHAVVAPSLAQRS
jgi:D-glycero-D-manno-heptose 1,7-bisphosphate phosphatase